MIIGSHIAHISSSLIKAPHNIIFPCRIHQVLGPNSLTSLGEHTTSNYGPAHSSRECATNSDAEI